jgi:hypothetical protein
MEFLKKISLHPFLFAVYPVLYLLSVNVKQVALNAALRPALVSLAAAGLILAVLRPVLKSWRKAALLTTLILSAFFLYGHLINFLALHPLAGIDLGRHRYLAPPYLAVFLLAAWLIIKARGPLGSATAFLNTMGLVLVLLVLSQTGVYLVRSAQAQRTLAAGNRSGAGMLQPHSAKLPDIYVIILDSYSRADTIQNYFQYDNHPFIQDLQKMGFYVPECSTSNYNSTDFSLASLLNLDYLPALVKNIGIKGSDDERLPALIKQSKVRTDLEKIGYKSVAFESGFEFSDWTNAYFITPPEGNQLYERTLQPFEALLLKTTAGLFFANQGKIVQEPGSSVADPFKKHVDIVRYTLQKLPEMPQMPGPNLIFAHIVVPHKPMVFNADGSLQQDPGFYSKDGDPIDRQYFQRGYINQVKYINSQMQRILETILAKSKTPPIIVMLGDHSFQWGEPGFTNLSAFYLPDGGNQKMQNTTSMVNIFRFIFDTYFSTQYGLLPNHSYVNDKSAADGFKEANANLTACPQVK